jgi:single-stranded-DNA-specific exonuclease
LKTPLKVGEFFSARGFKTVPEINVFKAGALSGLMDPETMPGVKKAVKILVKAHQEKKVVAIAGDYDVDGLTATALMYRVLTALGYTVITRVPNRLTEGYGLSGLAVTELAKRGAGLLVTVDCGVSDNAAVKVAKDLGLPVIVTDHHQLPPVLPAALAIVNPHLGGGWEHYPLAGVGVAFVVVWALKKALEKEGLKTDFSLVEHLSLVALGTVADLVPLKGANRILVLNGLNFLARSTWPGLAALRRKALKTPDFVSTRDIGFRLAPRLNAAGRLGETETALKLLLATEPKEAEDLAERLEKLNRDRLKNQNALLEEALESLANEGPRYSDRRTIVLAGDGWPKGLLGLAATRVAEMTQRATIIFGVDGDIAVGSGRGVKGFNLFAALEPLRDLCISMGGHSQAAGLRLKTSKLARFRAAFERSAYNQDPPDSEIQLDVDLLVDDLKELNVIAPALAEMEPFGQANPPPVAALKKLQVLEAAPTKSGGDRHLSLRLFDGAEKVSLIGFDLVHRLPEIGSRLDVALILETEKFGRRELNWRLLDFQDP